MLTSDTVKEKTWRRFGRTLRKVFAEKRFLFVVKGFWILGDLLELFYTFFDLISYRNSYILGIQTIPFNNKCRNSTVMVDTKIFTYKYILRNM